jgi:hypothetical protein
MWTSLRPAINHEDRAHSILVMQAHLTGNDYGYAETGHRSAAPEGVMA